MSTETDRRRLGFCSFSGKIRHTSAASARQQIADLRRMPNFRPGLHVYRCPTCQCWHVGHYKKPAKPKRDKRAKMREEQDYADLT